MGVEAGVDELEVRRDFILEGDDDGLGHAFADFGEGLQGFGVALINGLGNLMGGNGEGFEGFAVANPFNRYKQFKERTVVRTGEAS